MLRQVKNLFKRRLFRDLSNRSDIFGRLSMTELAVQFIKVNKIQGSYLEFGVFKGSTFANFYYLFRRNNLPISMFAFDGFQGLPQPNGVDATPGHEQFGEGEFSCSQEEFIEELSSRGIPKDAYSIIPGLFQESLTPDLYRKLDLTKAAIVYVDCDLYESTNPVLDFVLPILQDGTLLIFDDYFCFKGNPGFGERRAFQEFLERNPNIEVTDYAKFSSVGQAFIVHIQDRQFGDFGGK